MLEGVANVRDVGGIPVQPGSIRSGVLLRSATLASLTDLGRQQLVRLGVGTVVDLRTEAEERESPDQVPGVQVVRLPILEGAWGDPEEALAGFGSDGASAVPTLPTVYAGIIESSGPTFAAVAEVVASAPDAVLVHCTAGKDRTGLAVALLLDAVGAERAAVVADYAASQSKLSGSWLDGMLAMLARMGIPESPDVTDMVTASPASAITEVLDGLDARGGSLRYLRENGLTADAAVRLRERLVDA